MPAEDFYGRTWVKKTYSDRQLIYFLTLFDITSSAIPIDKKTIPMEKNIGNTDDAVKIGCHAGSFCCLNLESKEENHIT